MAARRRRARAASGGDRLLLVVDVGNTETVLGFFRGEELASTWRLGSERARTADECWLLIHQLAEESGHPLDDLSGACIASVVPSLTEAFRQVGEERLGARTVVVTGEMPSGVTVRVDNPAEVGADRIANAVAAHRLYGGPAVVVDLGTATTFDVVSRRGEYLGGAIAPGLVTSSRELFRRAARLSSVEFTFPDRVIGRNTADSLRSGILFGTLAQIDGILARIHREWKRDFRVLATGGLAGRIAPRSEWIEQVVPDLTLQGLRLIFDRVVPPPRGGGASR